MRWYAFGLLGLVAVGALACNAATAPIPGGCLEVKEWTKAELREMADAVDALPADSILVAALEDYGRMRAAARACRGARTG